MREQKMRMWIRALLLIFIIGMMSGSDLTVHAASKKTKTIAGVTYKITNTKKKTATVYKSSRSIKKANIADTVKINKKTYKVTSISKNAFKKRSKLKSVVVGKNVKTISSNAFYGCKKLVKITIKTKSLKTIEKNAFKGINKKAIFYVPKKQYKRYCKLIKKSKVGWKKTMKVVKDTSKSDNNTLDEKEEGYTYSVTPITDSVCYYFYVKTDNPDPESFVLYDANTTLSDSGKCYIEVSETQFADVVYTDTKPLRVNGGYIFYGYETDGGELKVMDVVNGKYVETKKTVTIPELKSSEQYLIDTYTTSSMTFFEKMSAVESGLSSICLYSGVAVLGELKKSTTSPYYGLSTSPHVDQTFYIQDPYYRTNSKTMLVSSLYPFRLDSIGFPSEMAAVAKLLDSSVTYKWNASCHWLIDITYNGETRSYGGAGNGGGKGITADLVKYKYFFDGTSQDTYTRRSWEEICNMICEYGDMTVVEEEKDLPELTWQNVTDTVGAEGSYVKLVLINSIFGGGGTGYTFLYKNGTSTYPGYFSGAWYDGRYFNKHEFFEKGTTFEDKTASQGAIIIKNPVINFPDAPEGKKYYYNYSSIDNATNYDANTGVWSGYVRYNFDSESNTWISDIYTSSRCYDTETRTYTNIEDAAFKEACTLTAEEVKAMQVDKNANLDPTSYYNYDMTVEPGTKVE